MYIGRALPLLLLSSALLASASSASSASAPYDVCSNATSAMSMASGGLSLSHPSEGSYQDCHAIPTAQYCLFTTALNVSGHAIPVTNGRCVPRQCTSSLLEGYVRGKLNVTEHGVQGFLDEFGPALAKYLNVTQGDLQRDLDVLEASADFAAVTSFTSPPPQPSTLTCLSLCVAWARVKFRFDPRGVFQALPPRSRGGAASHLRP